ncbi:hypothetical protein PMIN06_006520 [Paraphaeosphaeria minitans]|uniref:Uncharacterized protein n=1 Tax=Paraphaeosphaeria minitans TaxID=565426 RepID=A0A9P6GE16_9PLEO|nr:hypothetical protein PMIN01_08022 [Paraphaeosphaeria minitans]
MVKWDADKDRQILLGWLSFVDAKVEKGLTDHLAAIIGEGCTPKAVHRRIEKIQTGVKPKEQPTPDTSQTAKTCKGTDVEIENEGEAYPKTKGRKRGHTGKGPESVNKKVKEEDAEI